MSHLKLVTSANSSDGTAYAEAIEDLDAGVCIVDRDGSVLASNQAFCRLLDLPPDWADPKANKTPIPASEQLVTGWLARVAKQGGFAETVALSGRLIVQIVGKALPSGGVSLTLTEAANASAPVTGVTKQSVPQWVLHDAEENFRGVIENMADVYYHSDLQGNTTFGGPAIGRLLGYEPEEFEALDWRVLHVDPDRRAEFIEELERNGGQIRDFEAAFRHKNGEAVWLSSNIRYRYGEDGEPVGIEGVIRNISEQKSTQAALRESDARLRAVIDNSNSVILLKDLDGRFQFVGKGFEAAFGLTAEEVISKTNNDITPGDFADLVHAQDQRVIETGETFQEEVTVPFADGTKHTLLVSKFPVRDDDGNLVGVGGINTDITEQVAARRALAESETRFRTLLDYSPDSISLKDAAGRFLIVNKACEEVLGLSAEDMLGRTIWDVLPDGDWHDSDAGDASLLSGEDVIYNDELPADIPGRGSRVLRRTKFPVLDDDAQPIGVGTITTNVTEQFQAREQLRRNEAGFKNAEQLARMGHAERNFITGENYWSDGVFDVFGIEKRETVPDFDEIADRIHPDDRVIFSDMLAAMYAGATNQKVDFRLVSPSGEVCYVHELLEAYFGDDGDVTHCVAVIQDVTEAKLAEEALRKSEQRFHSLIDNLPSAVSLKDRDHRFISVNKSFEMLYGRTKESVVGAPLLSAMPKNNDWERIIATDQEILDGDRAAYEEALTLRFEDGEKRTFNLRKFPVTDDNGDISAVGTISTEITERLRAEERLRESEAKFHAIFDQAGLGIGLVSRDGDFIDVNSEMAEMFGLTRDEMIKEGIGSLTVEEDLERSQEQFNALLNKENDITRFEKRYLRKDGAPFDASLVSTTVSDQDGEFKFTVALIDDITERKKSERALRESEAHLRAITDHSPAAIYLKDIGGRYIFANKVWHDTYNPTGEDIVGKTVPDFVLPDTAEQAAAADAKVLETGEPIIEEQIAPGVEGSWQTMLSTKFPVRDEDGNIVAIGGVNTDISDRVAAERALRDSEEHLAYAQRIAKLGSWVWDLNTDKVTWSDALYRLMQIDPASAADPVDAFYARIHPDDRAGVERSREKLKQAGHQELMPFRIILPNGEERVMHTQWVVEKDESDRPVRAIGITQDVTEAQNAEQALRESEERFRTMIDNLPSAVTLRDRDYRYVLVNRAFGEVYAREPQEVLGHRSHEVFPARDWSDVEEVDEKLFHGEIDLFEYEYELEVAEGDTRLYSMTKFPVIGAGGEVANIGTISTDITERKKSEQALRESEQWFRSVIDNVPASVTLKDPDGKFLYVNKSFRDWYDVELDNVVGKDDYDVFYQEHGDRFTELDAEVLDEGQPVQREMPVRFADGSERILFGNKFLVPNESGGLIGSGFFGFDISRYKETEEMLRQAQKMEAVGQLTGGVAHDFNNLLAVVIGNLEMVADHLQADTPAFDFVRNAFTAAERGASLTHHLLAFSRQQVLRPVNTDLAKLIADTKDLMSVSIGEKVTMELKADDDLSLCQVDQAQLQNAILNLSINARDAMPSGGDVTISARNVTLDTEHAEALELDAGDYVCLSVSDNGPGIPEDVLEHVYEPFFTTKDVGEGSGLGLSMVYGFARQSGAGLEIETGEGEGTAVKIYFPAVVPDEPEAVEKIADTQDQISEPDAMILLVEDNAAFREITRAILESINFRVIDVGTAEEALAVIGDNTTFDLMLSDIGLPGDMDGHDLAQFAASARPGLKIVLMSAHTDRAAAGGIIDGNVAAFLRKPHRKADLSQVLHQVLGLDG